MGGKKHKRFCLASAVQECASPPPLALGLAIVFVILKVFIIFFDALIFSNLHSELILVIRDTQKKNFP